MRFYVLPSKLDSSGGHYFLTTTSVKCVMGIIIGSHYDSNNGMGDKESKSQTMISFSECHWLLQSCTNISAFYNLLLCPSIIRTFMQQLAIYI